MRRLFLAAFALAACQTIEPERKPDAPPAEVKAPAPAAAGPIHLTLVGTNDVHGWAMSTNPAGAKLGGFAALASYVKVLRDENPGGVLLLDAGDLFQGTLASNLSEGEVVIDAMNALGYDMAAIGNHEFDYGPVGPRVTAQSADEDPFGALKARIGQAKFPLLSANIFEKISAARPAWLKGDGTMIIERQGVKIGIIGLTTPQTPQTTLPINVASLRFGELAPEAEDAAKRLRARGAEVVVVVMHAGGRCGKWNDPNDTSSCDTAAAEVFTMLSALPHGTVDAVIAGHSHAVIGHFFTEVPVIETWGLGSTFGTIDLYVDPKTHAVDQQLTKIAPAIFICETVDEATGTCDPRKLAGKTVKLVAATFHGKPIVADEAVARVIEPALERVTSLQHKDLGLQVPNTLGRDYEAESALGSLLADSIRNMEHADVALVNPGGLRADLRAGSLTYGAVFEVMPFDNAVATLDLSGDELSRLLKAAYGGRKGVFQVSGLKVTLSRCTSPDRLKNVTLEGGKPLDRHARYRVVMPDFLARGGDGLAPALATIDPSRIDLGASRELGLRDAVVAFWQQRKKPLEAPRMGRVTLLSDKDSCPPAAATERGQ